MCYMRRYRNAIAAIGFIIGISCGIIISIILLPYYLQLLLLVASLVDPHNPLHTLALIVALVVTATPIGFGSTFLILVAAILYGWIAFPIVYSSYIAAGLITFLIARAVVRREWVTLAQLQDYLPTYTSRIEAIETIVSDHGFIAAFLLQMSACPYDMTLSNRISNFLAACSLSRIKLILYVYMGVNSTDLVALFQQIRSGESLYKMDLQTIISLMSLIFTAALLIMITVMCQVYLDRLRNRDDISDTPNRIMISPAAAAVAVHPDDHHHQQNL